jgi:hypothetical protein
MQFAGRNSIELWWIKWRTEDPRNRERKKERDKEE